MGVVDYLRADMPEHLLPFFTDTGNKLDWFVWGQVFAQKVVSLGSV
jgi:hypothetical protein